MAKRKTEPERLKGWQDIAHFLGQPVSVAQRWAKSGMPVTRDGRHVHASADELNRWLGRESRPLETNFVRDGFAVLERLANKVELKEIVPLIESILTSSHELA